MSLEENPLHLKLTLFYSRKKKSQTEHLLQKVPTELSFSLMRLLYRLNK